MSGPHSWWPASRWGDWGRAFWGRRQRPVEHSKGAELVATAAHELKTPLTVIIGMSDRLRRNPDLPDAEMADTLDTLERQTERMKQLIETLLDLDVLDHGSRPHRDRVSLTQVVADAVELIPPPERSTVSLHDRAPGLRAWGDQMELGRVLVNLLSNAYRYGGPHVNVEIREHEGDAVLAVSDDGPGVPDELLGTLFEPFTQGRRAQGGWGSGLGLALSRRLMESLHGTLSYVPQNPHGCRFEARLKVAR